MIARICIVAALVFAVLAFFGVNVLDLSEVRELSLGLALVCIAFLV